jgi:LPS export ABC transporter protein LptC
VARKLHRGATRGVPPWPGVSLGDGERKTMRSRRLLGVLFVLATLIVCAAGCDRDGDGGGRGSRARADQEIEGFTLTQTREGTKLWVLRADNALVFERADQIELTDLRIDFFKETGEVRSTLTADKGFLSRRTNDMEVRGDVIVYAADGTILTTETLSWNERTGKVETEDPVRVTKDSDVMTGEGVEADPDLKNIRVKRNFKAYVRTPEGELVEEE